MPSVAVDADGNFVVVWYSYANAGSDTDGCIQGQRYDASGNAVGSEFQVNTYTTGWQSMPSVAVDADGDFVVVWQEPRVQGQRYDASGNAVGSEFQVNTYTPTGWLGRPWVAVDADGDFVVVWGASEIWGQRYAGQAPQVPSLGPPGAIGLAVLLLGIAAAGLWGRLRQRA